MDKCQGSFALFAMFIFVCDLFDLQPGQVGIAKEQDEDREGFHI